MGRRWKVVAWHSDTTYLVVCLDLDFTKSFLLNNSSKSDFSTCYKGRHCRMLICLTVLIAWQGLRWWNWIKALPGSKLSLYQEQTKEVMGSIVVEYMGIFLTSAAEGKKRQLQLLKKRPEDSPASFSKLTNWFGSWFVDGESCFLFSFRIG